MRVPACVPLRTRPSPSGAAGPSVCPLARPPAATAHARGLRASELRAGLGLLPQHVPQGPMA
eukprot:15434253-Alexandrium_andersonii.AAC.1